MTAGPTASTAPAAGRGRRLLAVARSKGWPAVAAVTAALAAGVGLVVAGLGQALVIGVVTGGVYALMALGLVLVFKSSGVFNFAQGEFATVAIFVLWLSLSIGLPYPVGVLFALLASLAMGLAAERLVVRPLFGASRVTVLVASAGVALLAIGLEQWLGGQELRAVAPALSRPDRLQLAGVVIADQQLLVLAVMAALGPALALFFSRTDLGLAILGASQEPVAAQLAGIDVRRLSAITWGAAAVLGGLAGVLAAPISGFFTPGFMTALFLIPAFSAAVMGGMSSLPGAFVGGVVVGVVQSAAVGSPALQGVPGAGALAVFVLLVVTLVIRPDGLLGRRGVAAR